MAEQKKRFFDSGALRELVFGMEDGMVSTMGAITGIAVGSGSQHIVLLSGAVIIAVESISMGVGSYLSNSSEKAMEEKEVADLKQAIADNTHPHVSDIVTVFQREGWSEHTASQMAAEVVTNNDLLLNELSYRELGIVHHKEENPIKNGIVMWAAYIVGGFVPMAPYIFAPDSTPSQVIPMSVIVTLIGLFILGAYITKYSLKTWWKGGVQMLVLAGLAGSIGYIVGIYFNGAM